MEDHLGFPPRRTICTDLVLKHEALAGTLCMGLLYGNLMCLGVLCIITSNHSTQFTSSMYMSTILGTKHQVTVTYHPQAKYLVEQMPEGGTHIAPRTSKLVLATT